MHIACNDFIAFENSSWCCFLDISTWEQFPGVACCHANIAALLVSLLCLFHTSVETLVLHFANVSQILWKVVWVRVRETQFQPHRTSYLPTYYFHILYH